MALPIYYPFKSRVLNATTITSNTVAEVAVPARAQLLDVWAAPLASQTAAGAIDITINGSTAAGAGAIATTTSTAGTGCGGYTAAQIQTVPLYQVFGFSNATGTAPQDPGGFFDLLFTVKTVAATAAGYNFYASVTYVL